MWPLSEKQVVFRRENRSNSVLFGDLSETTRPVMSAGPPCVEQLKLKDTFVLPESIRGPDVVRAREQTGLENHVGCMSSGSLGSL